MPREGMREYEDRFVHWNLDGEWTIYKHHTRKATLQIGPGYIGQMKAYVNGKFVSNDLQAERHPWAPGALNEANYGGLGCFGIHYLREGGQFPGLPTEVNLRNSAALSGGSGVLSTEYSYPNQPRETYGQWFRVKMGDRESNGQPILQVTYSYQFKPNCVNQWITVEQRWNGEGPKLWLREPKIACAINPPQGVYYPRATLLSHQNDVLRKIELSGLKDPRRSTVSMYHPDRKRLHFFGNPSVKPLNIVARSGEILSSPSALLKWQTRNRGFDGWRQAADNRPRYKTSGEHYCLKDGHLYGSWEIAKFAETSHTKIMYHAWPGGTGGSDCLETFRAPLLGERWTVYMSYSLGRGYEL